MAGRYPDLKQFIKGKGGGTPAEMDQYEGLTVKYVGGHLPELHIFPDEEGDDTIVEKVDLTKIGTSGGKPTADDMKAVLAEKVSRDTPECFQCCKGMPQACHDSVACASSPFSPCSTCPVLSSPACATARCPKFSRVSRSRRRASCRHVPRCLALANPRMKLSLKIKWMTPEP
jgi:hypothetical protein